MNENKIKGGMKEAAGKTQKAAGDIEDKAKKMSKDADRR